MLQRAELGLPLPDELHRKRLIDLLARRWTVAVTMIDAPGGYGKSTVIAQSIFDNDANPAGYDVYLPIRAAHGDPTVLTEAILTALDTTAPLSDASADELLDNIASQLARFSPDQVCLHLDDLHVVADATGAVELVAGLIRHLPTNAHLVVSGRSLPRLPVSRLLAADQVLSIGAAELAFDQAEVEALAGHHEADPAELLSLRGWPAMTRLALVVGDGATSDFLFEEVIGRLPPASRSALAAVALAGRANDSLLAAIGSTVDLRALSARVPLVESLDGEWFRAHDLWLENIDRLVDEQERLELIRVIVPWHSTAGRHDQAVSTGAEAGLWTVAGRAVIAALSDGDVGANAETTQRWLTLFPSSQTHEPELLFLRGMGARLEHGAGHGIEDVLAALDMFEQRGDVHAAATAAFERGFQGWLANDMDTMLDALGRAPALIEAGAHQIEGMVRLAEAGLAEMAGDFRAALEATSSVQYKSLPRAFAELTARHAATMAFLVGDSERGVQEVERVVALDPSPHNTFVLAIARFEHGDARDVVTGWQTKRYRTVGNRRDDFWMAVFSCMVDASLGLEPEVAEVRDVAWDRSRERSFVALVSAAAAVLTGDEALASAELTAVVEELTLDDRLLEGELRRFLPYGYVLSPVIRAHFDDPALTLDLGPQQRRRLALARVVQALRSGQAPDWSGYESPEATLCGLPLPWSVEVACGLMANDPGDGLALAEYLSVVGNGAIELFRSKEQSPVAAISKGATAILASLAAPPQTTTEVAVCGELRIGPPNALSKPSRGRVRQLLGLLILRRSVTREQVAAMLWPDLAAGSARNNLRITLAHLRRELEPDRDRDVPSFHLRQHGDRLLVHVSPSLRVDLWQIQAGLDQADALARQGKRRASMTATETAIERWTGSVLEDLRNVQELRSELAAIDQRLTAAGVELAQWMLAEGRTDRARSLAERLIELEPLSERARAVLIAAHLQGGDQEAAGRAISECTQMLQTVGLSPSASTTMLIRRYENGSVG